MEKEVEMNRLAAFLANYDLPPEAHEDIRSKVSQAGCGFDDPMAVQIAVPEIIYYYNYAHLLILQTLTLEIVLKVIDAVRSEMATGGAALQRHNEGLARRFAAEAERHLGAIIGRVQRRLLWTSAAWIALGLAIMLGLGGAAGFYQGRAHGLTVAASWEGIVARQDFGAWSGLIAKNGDMDTLLDTHCLPGNPDNTRELDQDGRAFCWLPLRTD